MVSDVVSSNFRGYHIGYHIFFGGYHIGYHMWYPENRSHKLHKHNKMKCAIRPVYDCYRTYRTVIGLIGQVKEFFRSVETGFAVSRCGFVIISDFVRQLPYCVRTERSDDRSFSAVGEHQ